MALDILGPGSALNSVTVRPSQTTTYGATDTWFKPCTTLTSEDGTQLTNDWLNNVLAQLRTAMSGAGVVLDNGDDLLWRVIEVMAPRYAVDTGAVNALVITDTPPVPAYRPGLILAVKVAVTNTGAATIAPDGLTPASIVHFTDASALHPGELKVGAVALLIQDDSLHFRLINPMSLAPVYLQAPLTYYVNGTTGSDTLYDGTSATVSGSHGPFATIQKGVAQVPLYNLNGWSLTISVANGAYTGQVVLPQTNGSGTVEIIGNHATPGDVTLTSSPAPYVTSAFLGYSEGSEYFIDGFSIAVGSGTVVSDAGFGIAALGGCTISVGNIAFGACPGSHFYVIESSELSFSSNVTITLLAGANSASHITALLGGTVVVAPTSAGWPNYVADGAVAFTTFIVAAQGANTELIIQSLTGGSYVTGQKYLAFLNGTINSNGGGASYYPGSTSGATASGGQYV